MNYGNVESKSIDGLMEVVYDSGELSSSASSITISGLNGDVDQEYQLIIRMIGVNDGALVLNFNNTTASNDYGYKDIYAANATASAHQDIEQTSGFIYYHGVSSGNTSFSEHKIYAKSGYLRTIIGRTVEEIGNGGATVVYTITQQGQCWSNTVDSITSIILTCTQASGIGIGSRVILLRKVSSPSGMAVGTMNIKGTLKYAWQEVYKTTLGASASSVTISNLKGNSDVLYRLIVRPYNTLGWILMTFNTDTGSNYGYQSLFGVDTAVTAARATDVGVYPDYSGVQAGEVSFSETLIYAKSGYVRPMINNFLFRNSGTTVAGTGIQGMVWNNTVNEITQIVLTAAYSSGTPLFDAGTYICLERLNL